MILDCSSCQKPLLEILTNNDPSIVWQVKAACPYCGDHSFTKDLNGTFSYKGIEENGVPKTMVVDVEDVSSEQLLLFKVVKV